MCGIAVVLGFGAAETLDPSNIGEASAALSRRGPDGTVTWQDRGATFVSSRLTHWTAGSATQPYVGPDGTTAVFNGELFNLEELAQVVDLPGGSEISVIAEGIRSRGVDFLRHVDGQFAVVVRVGNDGPTYAARDRFGVCPLYIARESDRTAVASNLQALLALTGQPHPLSRAGLAGIVAHWAPIAGGAPYTGIDQVLPGHAIRLDGPQLIQAPWGVPVEEGTSEAVDAGEFESLLRASVASRMRSTTPVACLLSGGIDSTVIGALAAELGASTGIGLYLDGDDLVRDRQRQVADAVGLPLIQHRLDPVDTVSLLEEYVRTRRIPLVRLGPVGMMSLAKRTRAEGIRGVLSGEGADELFAGYDSYRLIAARAGQFGDPQRLPWSEFGPAEFGLDRGDRWMRAYWRGLVSLSPTSPTRRADVMRPVFSLLRPALVTAIDEANDDGLAGETLAGRRRADIDVLLGSYLMTVQGDHAWMEEGVELRPPYLGNLVADWALSQDPATFVTIGGGKLPVRRLLTRLAADRPDLAGLGFAKAAFRVDSSFIVSHPRAAARMRDLLTVCPDELVDTGGVVKRWDRCVGIGSCGEAESMLFLLTASLGILGGPPGLLR